jgi:hypothetical protein
MTRSPKRLTEREAFEAWARRHEICTALYCGSTAGRIIYVIPATQQMWAAWQARARRGKK